MLSRQIKRYLTLLSIVLHSGGYKRAEWLKRKKFFKHMGEHCYLQPWNFGTEPHMISFGDNVHVASDVAFVNHDITCKMFNYMDPNNNYIIHEGEIKIGDNVFIGARSIILYDVTIGNNVIIGAGSLVNKDIPDGCVAAGVPARVIGKFEDFRMKQKKELVK